jgi:SAM-dependent methyltransferase
MAPMIPRGEELREALLALPPGDRDAWVDELLALPEPPPDTGLPQGGVPYLPAGVEEILTAIRDVPVKPGDTFVDLGSGIGRVVMLVHLLTGARCHGVEVQKALVEVARDRAAKLGLSGVSFEHADAATAPLDGSVFFLYAPFNGELLKRVMKNLERVAARHEITVCTVDLALDAFAWLRARPTDSLATTVYGSITSPRGA